MARYVCSLCGYVFDEEKEGRPFSELEECPHCFAPPSAFSKEDNAAGGAKPAASQTEKESSQQKAETQEATSAPEKARSAPQKASLDYDPKILRKDPQYRYMDEIHKMATTGESLHAAMGTLMPLPSWDDILILGAQLDPAPLWDDDEVDTTTVIGSQAAQPLVIQSPVFISHMSFGALSREAKVALAKAATAAGTAMCSGEGGILPEEMQASEHYIFEYIPNHYSVTDENLQKASAIEIKIGQGTKPGMGGHLPGSKVTPEIAELRGKPLGEDIKSPSKFEEAQTKEDLKDLVHQLKVRSLGRPIGIKLAAGHIEEDLAYALYAEPDFVTLDGRGGATGSSPYFLREATTVPTLYALARARKFLDKAQSKVSLIITGGLRVSSDFIKALAMGADAIAVATAPLMALGCQQFRICGSGNCPAGIATQKENLRSRLDVEVGMQRVLNYLQVTQEEMKSFARITGHASLKDFSLTDLVTLNREISEYAGIRHA